MILCPECGARLMIVETRRNYRDKETYRQKRCPKCYYESYTIEREAEINKQFALLWRECAR